MNSMLNKNQINQPFGPVTSNNFQFDIQVSQISSYYPNNADKLETNFDCNLFNEQSQQFNNNICNNYYYLDIFLKKLEIDLNFYLLDIIKNTGTSSVGVTHQQKENTLGYNEIDFNVNNIMNHINNINNPNGEKIQFNLNTISNANNINNINHINNDNHLNKQNNNPSNSKKKKSQNSHNNINNITNNINNTDNTNNINSINNIDTFIKFEKRIHSDSLSQLSYLENKSVSDKKSLKTRTSLINKSVKSNKKCKSNYNIFKLTIKLTTILLFNTFYSLNIFYC